MNTQLYDKWIKSHQIDSGDIDIADVVMSRITEKAHKPNALKQTWESILLDLVQAKVFLRVCVLASGALMGLLRMVFQIYSVLFT
jgi:hypothetical protein